MQKQSIQQKVQQQITALIEKQQSLLLSTIDSSVDSAKPKQPFSSYAPYAYDLVKGEFYVLLSDLAGHAQNLINNPHASILIIEDEESAEQIFARERIQYQVYAEQVTDKEKQQKLLSLMQQRFGETIDVLSSLSDFRLFQLTSLRGRYVVGFGKAFKIKKGFASEISSAMSKDS